MIKQDWVNDPSLRNIDKAKIEFLLLLLNQSGNLKQTDMMPFMLAITSKAKKKNISFSQDEITAVVEVVRKQSSPEELEKINKVLQLTKLMG